MDKVNIFCPCSDVELMLQSSDFEKPPENSQMSESFIKELEECSTGSVAFLYEDKGQILLFINAGLWIRIRIGSGFRDFVEPDPDPYWESGSGSRGKKTEKFQWKKCTF
jgi:hypothetical protein